MPSLNSAFPKPKEEAVEKPKSYSQEVPALQWSDIDLHSFGVHSFLKSSIPTFAQVLERTGRLPGQKEQGFTTVSTGFVFSLNLFSFVCSGGEGQDGQQAVQLPHGHVQRGHHRGDHDTGTFQSQIIVDLKSQTLCQLDRCDTGIKSISDSDRDPYKSSRHPSLNQSAQK